MPLPAAPGAKARSAGRYIANATIVPALLDVKWGYSFDMAVKVLDPTNVATQEDSVAALQMLLTFTVRNPLRAWQETRSFYVHGNE